MHPGMVDFISELDWIRRTLALGMSVKESPEEMGISVRRPDKEDCLH